MSFLSTLFCCFDGDESNRKESSKISATVTSNTSKSVSSNTTAHTRPKPPKLTKTQSNLQKAFAHTNSSLNLAKADQSKIPLDLDKNKTSTEPTYSQKSSKDTPMLDSTSTAFQSPEYKELMNDLSGEKESTDSLKNDDDSINIQENQTQGTDDTAVIANVHKAEHDLPEFKEDDLNPISNLNEGSAMDIDTGKLIYENQFGIDLTKLLSNQTVSPSGWLLGEQPKKLKGKKCLVLDLDETLVHSSFKFVRQCDFVIPVEIENQIHNVYVIKRPGVDKFLKRVCEIFEVVVFTASVSRYGDPLLDILDKHKAIHHRLFRDSCYNYQGNYIKNLSQMGRPLEDLIIIDNSPASYVFHPQHAVPISSWFSDSHDCELTDLLPFLEDLAQSDVDDVRLVLDINI